MIRSVFSPRHRICAVLILWCSSSVSADSITGHVVSISDGDTLVMVDANQNRKTVRLAGIDAPEKLQDFGIQAKQQLTELCLDKPARADFRNMDRYGRTVARVTCEEKDVATLMLENGMAWHFSRYASSQPLHEAKSDKWAQNRAKVQNVGLWGMPEPVPPWDWRAKQRALK